MIEDRITALENELDELKDLVLTLVESNNQLTLKQLAAQQVIMSLSTLVEDKAQLKKTIMLCRDDYLRYAEESGEEPELTDVYESAMDEYLDLL